MSKVDSLLISYLRFPLAILVVAVHCYISIEGWDSCDFSANMSFSNFFVYFEIAASHVLSHLAVPIFFVISGFLFFQNLENWNFQIWQKKMKKRVLSLLIPYVIWILIYWIFLKCPSKIPSMFWCSEVWNIGRLDLWGNSATATAPLLIPMWFIRNLMVCLVLSPLLYVFLTNKFILPIFVAVLTFLYITQTSLIVPGFSMTSIYFFCIGSYLCLKRGTLCFCIINKKYFFSLLLLFFILLIVEVILDGNNSIYGNIVYPFFVCTGVFLVMYCMGVFAKSQKFPSVKNLFLKWSESTFFIFAFHLFVLHYAGRGIRKMLTFFLNEDLTYSLDYVQNHNMLMLCFFLLKILIATFGSISVYYILKRISPKICGTLCGR